MWLLHSFLRAASLVCRSLLGVRGYCLSVDSYVYPDTPLVASCQGSGGTVHRSATASVLTHRLSPAVGGQGGWSGTSALLHHPLSRGTVSRP
ncbi:hypothetical protein BHE74_00016718 [Ensete ventricosum]|nr:hypothetical protein BHE74_00016718 [Ensete ventricosum]